MSRNKNHLFKTFSRIHTFGFSILRVKIKKHLFKNILKGKMFVKQQIEEWKKGSKIEKIFFVIKLLNEVFKVDEFLGNVIMCFLKNF